MGWEPTTTYTYDDQGRLVSSTPETEWDDTERAWMLALQRYRVEDLCPICGRPKSVCQAPEAEFMFDVPPPNRCHITTALRRAQKTYLDAAHAPHPDALDWHVTLRAGAQ